MVGHDNALFIRMCACMGTCGYSCKNVSARAQGPVNHDDYAGCALESVIALMVVTVWARLTQDHHAPSEVAL